jgi:hypothetical protein
MLFNMDEGDTRKRRHDVRHASQLLPLARSLYLSAISCEDLELVASSVEEYFAWNFIWSWQHKWWRIRDKGQDMPAPLKQLLVGAFSARGRALA